MKAKKREELLRTAMTLFYQRGFHGTGIDKILAEAGVAKMTLYKYFRSKEELILAALRRLDEEIRNEFMREVERRGQTGGERLLAVFDVLEEWFAEREFHGCAFINASAEYTSHDDPIHGTCAEHKRLLVGFLRDLAASAKAREPEKLAKQLGLLMEGAIVMAHVCGEGAAAREAKEAARLLIDHATAGPRASSNASARRWR